MNFFVEQTRARAELCQENFVNLYEVHCSEGYNGPNTRHLQESEFCRHRLDYDLKNKFFYHIPIQCVQVAYEEKIDCKIAFFLHIPFPTWDIFKILPWNDEVLQGVLDCDLIGFHIKDYCINFIDCCQRDLGCKLDRGSNGSFR